MKCFLCGDTCSEMRILDSDGYVGDVCIDCDTTIQEPWDEGPPLSEEFYLGLEFDFDED